MHYFSLCFHSSEPLKLPVVYLNASGQAFRLNTEQTLNWRSRIQFQITYSAFEVSQAGLGIVKESQDKFSC
jgi:hypothetical protein